MLLVAIDFEHVAVAKGFYTPLGRWLRRISSVREAAAELEEAQDASGVLTLEETERRAELQEEPPPFIPDLSFLHKERILAFLD